MISLLNSFSSFYSYFRRSISLISTGGTPFLYLSFPSEPSDAHAFLSLLAQPYAFPSEPSVIKHSLKAMRLFTIKYFQVGYLSLSLDLNVL